MPFIITGVALVVIALVVQFFILTPKAVRQSAYKSGLNDGKDWIIFGEGNSLHVWFTPGTDNPVLRHLYEKGFQAGIEERKLAEASERESIHERIVEAADFASRYHI